MVTGISAERADRQNDRWLILTFKPISLFSLRMTLSTSSGGKSLYVPTPYAFKIAMVDAAFRVEGLQLAQEIFRTLKDKTIHFNPPEHLTINHTFIKIKREPKEKTPEEPYISSIAFRDYCYFAGELKIAVDAREISKSQQEKLTFVAAHINYFGKRGSFVQFTGAEIVDTIVNGYSIIPEEKNRPFKPDLYRTVQYLDDFTELQSEDLFDRINTYSNKSMELGKYRILKQYLLPYKVVSTSKSFTYLKKIDQ